MGAFDLIIATHGARSVQSSMWLRMDAPRQGESVLKLRPIIVALGSLLSTALPAFARVEILWDVHGWGVYDHTAFDLTGYSGFILESHDVKWQLIYAGGDGDIDPPDLSNAANGYASGDDVVWAQRDIPLGGNAEGTPCADGTTWDLWMYSNSGDPTYVDHDWATSGYVYQRVYEGTLHGGSWYYDTPILALKTDDWTQQEFYLDSQVSGVQPNQQYGETATNLVIFTGDTNVDCTVSSLEVNGWWWSEGMGTMNWFNDLGGDGTIFYDNGPSLPPYSNSGMNWSFSCPLHPGTNYITVQARNSWDGRLVCDWLTVIRDPDAVIHASAGANGSISPSGIVEIATGSTQMFVMTPRPYYSVQDVQTNGASVGAPTNFTWPNVTGINTIKVTFVQSTTAHGTPHVWLATNGWAQDFEEADLLDFDEDGLENWKEFDAETNPRNANSDGDQYNDGTEWLNGANPLHDDSQVYGAIRDNPAAFNYFTSNSVGELGYGHVMLAVSNNMRRVRLNMKQSDDLGSWTDVEPPVLWEVPAASNRCFYRFIGN